VLFPVLDSLFPELKENRDAPGRDTAMRDFIPRFFPVRSGIAGRAPLVSFGDRTALPPLGGKLAASGKRLEGKRST
jgi:hypothetical protein